MRVVLESQSATITQISENIKKPNKQERPASQYRNDTITIISTA